jgi:2-phosphosulfolactate phosphatase
MPGQPSLYTSLSPALLHLYDLSNSVTVIIDVFRATSTIAAALHNGAKAIIPVDSVPRAIEISKNIDCIAAGERDGMIAAGLEHGNSPLEYHREFIENRILVLTTTNGTR